MIAEGWRLETELRQRPDISAKSLENCTDSTSYIPSIFLHPKHFSVELGNTPMNLFALLHATALRLPDRGAVYRGDRLVLTFAELRSRAAKIAHALRRDYVEGDRIAIFSENCPQYVELFFGIWAAGMVATPINGKLHEKEVSVILGDAGARAVFTSAKHMAPLSQVLAGAQSPVRLVEIGSDAYEALLTEELTEEPPSDPDRIAWLFFTSGTTGRSKGARLSHRNLMTMTMSHLADIDDPDPNSSLIHAAPMSHGSGLYIPPYISRGARQVIPDSGGFQPDEFLDLSGIHPGCCAFFAPTMVQRLRLRSEETGRRPANLKTIIYGGGPMYLEEIRRSLNCFGPVFTQIYGLGESPMTITGLRRADFVEADDEILASVGWPRMGAEVRIIDEAGAELPPGEIGEIVVRGDMVMQGYWNDPEATCRTLVDGWLRTGDMGSFSDRGLLTLRDRIKDMIVTGGANVYPREVEEVLLTHEAAGEVSVIGLPDPEWGEIVVAVVVPATGYEITETALDALCVREIARFKRPKKYVFLDSLPKNNYGKVVKRELRDMLRALA
ncbi:AMP-binding protein [Pseudochelatococcus sp. B33]